MNGGIAGPVRCTRTADLAGALTLRDPRFPREIAPVNRAPTGAAHENFKKCVQKRTTTVDNTMTAR
jgi:hypothetical protein